MDISLSALAKPIINYIIIHSSYVHTLCAKGIDGLFISLTLQSKIRSTIFSAPLLGCSTCTSVKTLKSVK